MAKVLVIDDEENLQKLVRANLTARRHEVVMASNGENGLKMAEKERPDLIFLDLMMPGMSGWDVLERLKANDTLKQIPVVIMTASIQKSQEEKALGLGAHGYLIKPFGVEELMRHVKGALPYVE